MSAVDLVLHGAWAEITLNRPERKNAIDMSLAQALYSAVREVEGCGDVRAVVLRGAGGAFCSGLDVKAFAAEPAPEWLADFPHVWDAVHGALIASHRVWIVALERFAINGGAALALAGDLLICGQNAFMQIAELTIGKTAPRNVAWLALRHTEAVASRLCFTGDRVGAPELQRLGIATTVVEDDLVLKNARQAAQRIAGYDVAAVHAMKSGIRAAFLRMPTDQWSSVCSRHDPLAEVSESLRLPRASN